MIEKRFKIYNKETMDTYIEDTREGYSYWFNENEDFCALFDKLNQLSDENDELKHQVNCLQDRLDDLISVKKENEHLKQQIRHLQSKDSIIRSWLRDEDNLTLEKYDEIMEFCYQEYKKEMCNE